MIGKAFKEDIDFPFASGDLFDNRQIEFQHDPPREVVIDNFHETRIEDRMIVLQRGIDEGIMAGRSTRVQGREFQLRLDGIRREFLQRIKDRPFTPEGRMRGYRSQ